MEILCSGSKSRTPSFELSFEKNKVFGDDTALCYTFMAPGNAVLVSFVLIQAKIKKSTVEDVLTIEMLDDLYPLSKGDILRVPGFFGPSLNKPELQCKDFKVGVNVKESDLDIAAMHGPKGVLSVQIGFTYNKNPVDPQQQQQQQEEEESDIKGSEPEKKKRTKRSIC